MTPSDEGPDAPTHLRGRVRAALLSVLGPRWGGSVVRGYLAFEEFCGLLKRFLLAGLRFLGRQIISLIDAILLPIAALLTRRRIARGAARTLWGYTPILTLPHLAACDKLLGLQSESVVFSTYHISRQFDVNLQEWNGYALWMSQHVFGPSLYLFRLAVLYWITLRYDVISSFYDRSVLPGQNRFGLNRDELRRLKSSGTRIYTYAYGADVRTRDITMALGKYNCCIECPEPGTYCICSSRELNETLSGLSGTVTARIAMGDMTAYVPGCRNMHHWPLDVASFSATERPARDGRSLRVAHAPNHPEFKGSRHIIAAVDRLRKEGHAIELVQISGVLNAEVLRQFSEADLIVDQLHIGFHGYTALEAMAVGRPVVCYIRDTDMLADAEACPILNANPDTIYDVLLACLQGEMDLSALGAQGRRYVERYYDLPAVAARLGNLYLDTADFGPALSDKLKSAVDHLESQLPSIDKADVPARFRRAPQGAGSQGAAGLAAVGKHQQ